MAEDNFEKKVIGLGYIECEISQLTDLILLKKLESTYPIKLISTQTFKDKALAIYSLTYGGGLVSGDSYKLVIKVGENATLSLLTQASTKVYKKRQNHSVVNASVNTSIKIRDFDVIQSLTCYLNQNSLFCLLPEPVTNLIILDWFTSGRMSNGEVWKFEKYCSLNQLFLLKDGDCKDKICIFNDCWLLEDEHKGINSGETSYSDRVKPYQCYGTLILYGAKLDVLKQNILKLNADNIITGKALNLPPLIFSSSTFSNDNGLVVRVAALETILLKNFILNCLDGLQKLIGKNIFI
ncbi:hypothetical protein HK099_006013 [Clydaea vesicula]|uniref:Urease accessory protein UreD n=1 Tax=Clydaea vesicula TaxID=447962 RepID=A0AAD5TYP3_9FUNG|nr:hypothetical protein HK099_006013 [Clydaea vesicula]